MKLITILFLSLLLTSATCNPLVDAQMDADVNVAAYDGSQSSEQKMETGDIGGDVSMGISGVELSMILDVIFKGIVGILGVILGGKFIRTKKQVAYEEVICNIKNNPLTYGNKFTILEVMSEFERQVNNIMKKGKGK